VGLVKIMIKWSVDKMEQITIYESDVKDFFYKKLIEKGHVPSQSEIVAISDIFFDFLIEKDVIDKVIQEECNK
jgi:hypothetical protein